MAGHKTLFWLGLTLSSFGGKSLPTMVLCWQQNLVLALVGLIEARAGREGDGFIRRQAGATADKLEGCFFSFLYFCSIL